MSLWGSVVSLSLLKRSFVATASYLIGAISSGIYSICKQTADNDIDQCAVCMLKWAWVSGWVYDSSTVTARQRGDAPASGAKLRWHTVNGSLVCYIAKHSWVTRSLIHRSWMRNSIKEDGSTIAPGQRIMQSGRARSLEAPRVHAEEVRDFPLWFRSHLHPRLVLFRLGSPPTTPYQRLEGGLGEIGKCGGGWGVEEPGPGNRGKYLELEAWKPWFTCRIRGLEFRS